MTTEPSETKVEFDLNELLKGSVESVTEKLGALSDGELATLHTLEDRGAKRVTLTDAIHREQKAREDKAAAEPAVETFTRAQVDEMLADRDKAHAEALAKVTNAKAPKAAKAPIGKLVTFDAKSAPADAAKGGGSVLFLDDAGHSLPGLPEPSFGAGEFERVGAAVRLKAAIDFPSHMKGAEIAGAALMVGGKAVGRAMLVAPFRVGNGKASKFGSGTLMFEPATSIDAPEADGA